MAAPYFLFLPAAMAGSAVALVRGAKREKGKREMKQGFGGGAVGRGFDAPSCALNRPIWMNGRRWSGHIEPRRGKEFAGQAQVAAWARRRREREPAVGSAGPQRALSGPNGTYTTRGWAVGNQLGWERWRTRVK